MENTVSAPQISMTPEQYLKERVEGQISWYDRKSSKNKRWYFVCQWVVIVCGALIPLLIGISNDFPVLKYFAALLGVLVAITESISSLQNFKENWVTYRAAFENLTREKLLFQNGIGDYAESGYDFKVFVLKAEQIMSGENNSWLVYAGKKEDKKPSSVTINP